MTSRLGISQLCDEIKRARPNLYSQLSMLYIEEDGNLSPVQMMDKLDIGKGHKSDGDHEGPPTPSQVRETLKLNSGWYSNLLAGDLPRWSDGQHGGSGSDQWVDYRTPLLLQLEHHRQGQAGPD